MLFEFDSLEDQKAKIKVIGVGGAGGNAINRMISSGLSGVEFVAINTDAQDLENNNASTKIQIGKNLTKGLGAGAKSDIGKAAMEDEKDAVANIIEDADMIFVTAGMGGGTGTGAAPIIAQISRELGALTVGIVTKPFNFEGPKRMNRANSGLEEMQKNCDTIIVIPNQKLINIADKNTTLVDEQTAPFYKTIVKVNPSDDLSDLEIQSGMVGQVSILGDKRTVLSFFTSPITKLSQRAFRE